MDADAAKCVVLLTEEWVDYPNYPASIAQDQFDLIVQVEEVGDPAKITAGAIRLTSNARASCDRSPGGQNDRTFWLLQRRLLFANRHRRRVAGGNPLPEDKMRRNEITASFGLGGITGTMVDLHEKGLIKALLDTQSFDGDAARSLANNPNHIEISANQYANPSSKGISCERLNVVMLSALEIDTGFNVSVMTGSNGVLHWSIWWP